MYGIVYILYTVNKKQSILTKLTKYLNLFLFVVSCMLYNVLIMCVQRSVNKQNI